jgi:hypothetical protein
MNSLTSVIKRNAAVSALQRRLKTAIICFFIAYGTQHSSQASNAERGLI